MPTEVRPSDSDDLAPARGIAYALLICLPFWAVLAVACYFAGCR